MELVEFRARYGAKVNAKLERLEEAIAEQQRQIQAKDTIIETLQKKLDSVATDTATNSTEVQNFKEIIKQLKEKGLIK